MFFKFFLLFCLLFAGFKIEASVNLKHDQLHQDMEDFLYKMLGDGFQLDRNMKRGVFGK